MIDYRGLKITVQGLNQFTMSNKINKWNCLYTIMGDSKGTEGKDERAGEGRGGEWQSWGEKEIGESGGSRGEGQKNLRGVGDGGKGEGYIIIYEGEQSRQSWASWILARYILSWEKLCGLFSASNWQNQKQRGKSMLWDIHQERQAWIKGIKTLD